MDNQATPNPQQPSPPIVSPLSPEKSSKQNLKKWIFLLAGIVLVLASAGSYFVLSKQKPTPYTPTPIITQAPSPTPDPTANWKTFSQLKGTIFKYPPSDWSLNQDLTPNEQVSTITLTNGFGLSACKGDCPTFSITFDREDNPQNLHLADFIKNYYGKEYQLTSSTTTTNTSGLSFIKVTGSAAITGSRLFSLFIKNGTAVYIISPASGVNGTPDDEDDPQVKTRLEVLNQILSTFKFVDQPAPTCRPRPACLDSMPRCMIPETPDMCPKTSPTKNAEEKCKCWDSNQQVCLPQSACQ